MTDFRSFVHIVLWPVKEVELTATAPPFTFKGEEIDLEGTVSLKKDKKEVSVTLWNLGDAETAQGIFKKNFLLAVDLRRIDGPGRLSADYPMTRVVVAKIKDFRVVTQPESADIGFQVTAIPLTEYLREVKIRYSFTEQEGPWRVKTIVETLLKQGGIGIINVDISPDLLVTHFTANGTLWSEIKRAVAKAGVSAGIWMQGATLRISDTFVAGKRLTDEVVFDAAREESGTVQPELPIPTAEPQVTGQGQDLSEQYGALEESDQMALQGASANTGYHLELPITPDIFEGSYIEVEQGVALEKMGFFRTRQQQFNVVGVEHKFSTFTEGDMDETQVEMTLRPEEAAA